MTNFSDSQVKQLDRELLNLTHEHAHAPTLKSFRRQLDPTADERPAGNRPPADTPTARPARAAHVAAEPGIPRYGLYFHFGAVALAVRRRNLADADNRHPTTPPLTRTRHR